RSPQAAHPVLPPRARQPPVSPPARAQTLAETPARARRGAAGACTSRLRSRLISPRSRSCGRLGYGKTRVPDRSVRRGVRLLRAAPPDAEAVRPALGAHAAGAAGRGLLRGAHGLPVAAPAARVPALADRLPLLQALAPRRALGAAERRAARAG